MDRLVAASIFLIALSVFSSAASATDPDPLQDFCVADINSTLGVNGFACKPSGQVSVEDFITRTLRSVQPTSTPNAFIPTPVFVQQIPALNTAGMSMIRGDLGPGGVNSPHVHPRATELVLVQEGKVQVGFVDTSNKLFVQILEKGDVIVIPRAVVHFQFNVGTTPAVFFAIFNSQNPGVERLPETLFGSGIPDSVLDSNCWLHQIIYSSCAVNIDDKRLPRRKRRKSI